MHAQSPRLTGIEALRGLAAVAVVLSHAARHVDKAYGDPALVIGFQAGHAGVDLFFVISGFIILFVHHADVGEPERLRTYILRRFTRVMPLYWIALGVTALMEAAGSRGFPPLSYLLWSASLLPMTAEPVLGIAWTLQFEVFFYAVFAVVILSRSAGLVVFGIWLTVVAAGLAGWPLGLPGAIAGSYAVEFFFGMAAAVLVLRQRVRAPLTVAWAGGALFLGALAAESAGVLDGFASWSRFAYGVPAALIVAGVATANRAGQVSVMGWMRAVGEASYSIYLFQFVFIGAMWQAWLQAGLHLPKLALFLMLATVAVGGGVLCGRFVERPLLRLVRQRRQGGIGAKPA